MTQPMCNRAISQRYDPEIPGIVTSRTKTKRAKGRKEKPIEKQIDGGSNHHVIDWGKSSQPSEPYTPDGGDKLGSLAGVEPEGVRASEMSQDRKVDSNNCSDSRNIMKLVTEIDALDAICGRYANDTLFGKIMQNIDQFQNYKVKDGP